jgi:DNA-binding transcriptional regulator YdaS (Cro superfamily)
MAADEIFRLDKQGQYGLYNEAMKMKIPVKVADRIGVDRSYIKKINRGIRRPSLKTARKIIEAMEGVISLEDLRPDIVNLVQELSQKDEAAGPATSRGHPTLEE